MAVYNYVWCHEFQLSLIQIFFPNTSTNIVWVTETVDLNLLHCPSINQTVALQGSRAHGDRAQHHTLSTAHNTEYT